ncbi:predicted protein [Aspergillus nidulans FGSC A4]|uniref:Uncharacterized protein n=1 Tax=Emericella nidulans (strain FGSC A4 / ATCC 38163 / CBS 112.46 / NRRL 194 / M139) TaxID=227321 RepID=Q5ASR5_EMENI|nr:hypothetical protein [Aspergillus nidulans FGSC A4]EAA60699.1 predicted protein [Aspergillus nidulans FGSC A4]CBF78224.1 TPA: conserved hypothetical protein [Aspergillus nidulans FGSC A4]|eukprot:XP_681934.1 predicted protein [Aspergillus nidulans FGSC A4]
MDKIDQGSFRGLQAELSMMNAVYLLEEAKADKPEPTIVDCSHGFSTKDTADLSESVSLGPGRTPPALLGEDTPALAASRTGHRKNAGYTGLTAFLLTTSYFTTSRELKSRGKHARQQKLLDRRSPASRSRAVAFRLWTVTSAFAFRGHWEGAGSVSSRSVLGQSEIRDHLESAQKWSYAVIMHLPVGVSSNSSMGEWG